MANFQKILAICNNCKEFFSIILRFISFQGKRLDKTTCLYDRKNLNEFVNKKSGGFLISGTRYYYGFSLKNPKYGRGHQKAFAIINTSEYQHIKFDVGPISNNTAKSVKLIISFDGKIFKTEEIKDERPLLHFSYDISNVSCVKLEIKSDKQVEYGFTNIYLKKFLLFK